MVANIIILFDVMCCESELFFVGMLIFRDLFLLSELNLWQRYYMFVILKRNTVKRLKKEYKGSLKYLKKLYSYGDFSS